MCDLNENPPGGNWRWLATDAEGMTARAAHSAVYIEEEDALYVFGGYDLNNVISTLQVLFSTQVKRSASHLLVLHVLIRYTAFKQVNGLTSGALPCRTVVIIIISPK